MEDFDGHTLYADETLDRLFGVIIDCICTAGGDGSGVIVSKNYAYYANKFESYFKLEDQCAWEKMAGKDFITFHCYQDNMIFTSNRDWLGGWEEIVVELM